jgi:hypothetical protein
MEGGDLELAVGLELEMTAALDQELEVAADELEMVLASTIAAAVLVAAPSMTSTIAGQARCSPQSGNARATCPRSCVRTY